MMSSPPCHAGKFFLFLIFTFSILHEAEGWSEGHYGYGGDGTFKGVRRRKLRRRPPGVARCIGSSKYTLNLNDVVAAMPGFEPPALSCGGRRKSLTNPEGCLWIPSSFLAMLFNRGVELMRMGVPQEDAFKWCVRFQFAVDSSPNFAM